MLKQLGSRLAPRLTPGAAASVLEMQHTIHSSASTWGVGIPERKVESAHQGEGFLLLSVLPHPWPIAVPHPSRCDQHTPIDSMQQPTTTLCPHKTQLLPLPILIDCRPERRRSPCPLCQGVLPCPKSRPQGSRRRSR